MVARFSLPSVMYEDSVIAYLKEIQKIPMLTAEEEYSLATRCKEESDLSAAHKLVTSHLKLVAKIAMKFRSYGLPVMDLIAEGNIGLMHAVKKFDPEMGHRLSTYAMWWIKASIQDYVLKSWSIVKIGTSAVQKKLFFNLKKAKEKIGAADGSFRLHPGAGEISEELGIEKKHIDMAEHNLTASVLSLNSRAYGEDSEVEILETIAESEETQENIVIEEHDNRHKMQSLTHAINCLSEREKDVITARRLRDKPLTLEALSLKYSVSRERIRQIEEKALQKLKEYMQNKYAIAD